MNSNTWRQQDLLCQYARQPKHMYYVHCEKRGICVRGIPTNLMSTVRVRFTFGKLVQRVLQLVKHARTAPRCQVGVLGTSRKDV